VAYFLPLHPAHLKAVPPTTIVTAEYDLLKDEADMFATANDHLQSRLDDLLPWNFKPVKLRST